MPDQQKYVNKLQGQRILVIGGTSGIGFAAAEASLESGASAVIISSSSPEKITSSISRIQKAYPSKASQVTGHACNFQDTKTMESNIKTLLDFATDKGSKKLDHIIFTAGDKLQIMPLSEVSLEFAMERGMVRFYGPLMTAKHASSGNYMNPGPASSIVMTTGAGGEKPHKNWSMYGGYLAGLQGMCRGLALDLAPLRVNLISPGAVLTELWDGLPADAREGFMKSMETSMATGEIGKPEDVAQAYLYCMKDHNITGSVLSTNGGSLLT